jgi:hyaluronan synthase/N-acetylglucosaminyltransferase
MNLFEVYLAVYTFVAFFYLWYRYIFILVPEQKISSVFYNTKVSVIIPFYNEKPDLITRTVKSAYDCYGDKEIIVIDDGSKSLESYNALINLKKKIPFELIRYEQNKGKRHAQTIGFSKAKGKIIMTLDSDSILNKRALVELLKAFVDDKVGAATGQLEVLNEKKNLLTKIQGARYWNSFNFERKSQSNLGSVICCSGPISAYRASILNKISYDYQNQKFLGDNCTYGDDRHLTTLILKHGYKVKYVKEGVAYTEVPETFKKYIKQQIRWKKSYLRETLMVSKFMFKNNPAVSFEVCITTFILFFSIFARIGLIFSLLLNFNYIIPAIVLIGFMSVIHSLYVLFNKPKYFVYSVLYGYVHAFLIYWLVFIALFTLKDTKWGTR